MFADQIIFSFAQILSDKIKKINSLDQQFCLQVCTIIWELCMLFTYP